MKKNLITCVICSCLIFSSAGSFSLCNEKSVTEGFIFAESSEKEEENIFDYTVSEDGRYCVINGIIDDTDPELYKVLEVPADIEGLPVRKISDNAFRHNAVIEKAVLPEGMDEIGYAAFAFCSSLSDLNIPSTVNKVSVESFHATPWLAAEKKAAGEFLMAGDNVLLSYTENDDEKVNEITAKIPDGVRYIGREAFSDTKKTTCVCFPEGLSTVYEYAFADCSSVKKVKINSDIKEINDFAFWNCGLKEISLPKKIAKLGIGSLGFVKNGSGIAAVDKEFCITGYEFTIAQWYANKNSMEFIKYEDKYDVNGDCEVNGYDVSEVKAMVFSYEKIEDNPVLADGDMNNDGTLNVFDVLRTKRELLSSGNMEENNEN